MCVLTCVSGAVAIVHGACADAFPLWTGKGALLGL